MIAASAGWSPAHITRKNSDSEMARERPGFSTRVEALGIRTDRSVDTTIFMI
jgi:hypothetical protein